MRRCPIFACVVPFLLAACTEPNPSYCPGEVNNRCFDQDASPDAAADIGVDLAVDAVDAEDGAAADAGGCDGDSYCEDEDPSHPLCENRVCTGCASSAQCEGTTPICGSKHRCESCSTNASCRALSSTRPACDPDTGACVECITSDDCSGTKPICDTALRVCGSCGNDDSKCAAKGVGPGVCMADGRCATEAETVYVQYKATGCPQQASPTTNAYCDFETAIARFSGSDSMTLIVVRGPVVGPLRLAIPGEVSVVGQASAGGGAAISVGPGNGVEITAGQVLVRDLKIYGGGSSQGRGVLVSGAGAKARLLQVLVSGNDGIGIEAKSHAELEVIRSIIRDNKEGGLWNNGAKTVVSNSVLTKNLYGVMYDVSALSSVFEFNTVVDNVGNGATCSQNNAQPISESIINGANVLCTNDNSFVSMTASVPFDATGYHLTKRLGCPTAPKSYPANDIDGQPRSGQIDCGADQFWP